MPNVMAVQPKIGGALCESSVISFLLPMYENARLGHTMHLHVAKFRQGPKAPNKCIYNVPAQDMAKDRAKFGWPPVSDVAAVMKPRRENR